jgi:hypothetical protein
MLAKIMVLVRVLQGPWWMDQRLSMATKAEITKKHAAQYAKTSRKAKGVMLDQLVATTGWSRANARRALMVAAKRKGPASAVKRKPRRDSSKVLAKWGACLI